MNFSVTFIFRCFIFVSPCVRKIHESASNKKFFSECRKGKYSIILCACTQSTPQLALKFIATLANLSLNLILSLKNLLFVLPHWSLPRYYIVITCFIIFQVFTMSARHNYLLRASQKSVSLNFSITSLVPS